MRLLKFLFALIIFCTVLLTGCGVNDKINKENDKNINALVSDSSSPSKEKKSPWEIAFKSTFPVSKFCWAAAKTVGGLFFIACGYITFMS